MARLAAKAQALFYPTPIEVMELIAGNIISTVENSPDERVGSILDPCCGTGEPLALLSSHLNLIAYGNELHPERYAQAKPRLDYCVNGAREFLQVEGQFNVIFNNPPYDQAFGGERMEVTHLQHDLDLLIRGGLGIWVVPETILDYSVLSLLVTNLRQIAIRRFPMPEYERFKQVVVFGIKREESATYTYASTAELEALVKAGLPVLQSGECTYQFYIADNQITRFALAFPDVATVLAELDEYGIQTSDTWETVVGSTGAGFDSFQPVLRLTSGHTAMTIAAGIVNGTEVVIDGEPYLIKGSTSKQITVIQDTAALGDGDQQTVREREKLVQVITALNLDNGTLATYSSQDDKEGFAEFLLTHQQTLVETIERTFPPLFEPDRDMPSWLSVLSKLQAPGKLPTHTTTSGLLPAQQVRAAALATRLHTAKAVVLVGEMGVGKTATAQALAALVGKGNWKLVVVAPSQVAPKWAREAKIVLAQFGISVHLIGQRRRQADGAGKARKVAKPVLDVIRAMEEASPSVLVMSYEVAKNGPRWEHAPAWQLKILRYAVEVEEPIATYPYKKVVERVVTQAERVLCCPDCGEMLMEGYGPLTDPSVLGKRKRWCSQCGAALWQQVPFKYGGRVAIADFLNRHYAGRYNLILDEAHVTKGADSDAAYASTDLIAGARKVVAMTGTIYAGKASSIFYLLYRLLPQFRELYGYNEVQRFIEHYGLQETIITTKSSDRYHSSYGYAREQVRTREIPGVSPGMVTMLLPNTAFLKLADVGFVLPPYVEERFPIPLDERLEDGLDQIAGIYEDAARLAREGNPGLLSAWLYASLGWMDCPLDEVLTAKNTEGEAIASYEIDGLLASPDELMDDPLPKDLALLEIIQSELAQGRGVGVYFAQVNRRDWMGRVQQLLQKQGIYSEILRQATCPPAEREAWYKDFVARCRAMGQEPVLLANGNLVKEGLDLVELPTLIETGIEYRINDLRQRDRRSWRLIQDRPVRVIFLYYESSWQETALQLVAAKLKAALMVEGNLAEGLAAMDMDDGGNLMDALMKAVAAGQRKKVAWSGMQIASVETLNPDPQPPLLPDVPHKETRAVDIVQVDVGAGAAQLSWGDLFEVASITPARSKPVKKEAPVVEYTKVIVKDGVEQSTFL